MSSSSRADLASAPSTSRRPGPRSRALRISAATIRSADGVVEVVGELLQRVRQRLADPQPVDQQVAGAGRIAGAASHADAGIACSRPTAPAMVSRSDSVQAARPSSRAIAASARPRAAEQRPADRTARSAERRPRAPTHRVSASTTQPRPRRAERPAAVPLRSAQRRGSSRRGSASRASRGPSPPTERSTEQQRRRRRRAPAEREARAARIGELASSGPRARAAMPAGSRAARAPSMQAIGACAHDPPVRARREHLAGQHPAVDAVDLADAGDHAAQPAAVGVVVAPARRRRRSRSRRRSASCVASIGSRSSACSA